MPTSSGHIIDSLWGRRSSLDSLRDERLNWILLTHLLIWRILCAVLERYFCNRIPLQITRRSFWYSVCDRYRAFISANPMWKCSFDIVLISPNRRHRRNFFMPKCQLTPVTQHCTGAGVASVAMLSSLAALEVVISTTYDAASDESAIRVATFPFQWASIDNNDNGAICAGRITVRSAQSHCDFSLCVVPFSLLSFLHVIIILCYVCLFYVIYVGQ